jgi:peptide/nickel transport system substrate-binding protein
MVAPARLVACALALVLLGSCTGGDGEPSQTPRTPQPSLGGTLRVAFPTVPASTLTTGVALDPQRDYFFDSWAVFRCCLLRTLLSHNGRSTEEGGAELRPDLAAALPEVSADALSWTFRIKPGINYGPPFQDTEIVAADFVRALEREADPEVEAATVGYAFYYSAIQGFDDFAAGRADSISGLEVPDPHTLIVHLNEPTGDLGNRFSMAATAPIPEGAAEGHQTDYGSFLVSSGPYMLEGSEQLDFSVSPVNQEPVSGYTPSESITLVRNPSWRRSADALRPAYPDRIEFSLGGTMEEWAPKVDEGAIDMQLFSGPPPQAPLEQIQAYQDDPERSDQLFVNTRDFIRYIPINVAVPPFDDIHVRRALNYAIDKTALRDLRGGEVVGEITGHIALNSLENNLLVDYDPYATDGGRGDLAKAKEEMRQSKYDRDKDGMCDVPACRDIYTPTFPVLPFIPIPWDRLARSIRSDLAAIGIELDVQVKQDVSQASSEPLDPTRMVPISIGLAWGKDYLNASNFFEPLFSYASLGSSNATLVGATPEQLREWGYEVESVPSIDAKIAQCKAAVGVAQVQCWSEADQLLMETVVPWVPYIEESRIVIVSNRVASYSFDQFTNMPAFDRIALKVGSD